MKHFETLWEESEKISAELKEELSQAYSDVKTHLEMLKICPQNRYDYHMGMLIFNLSTISRLLNINTYIALDKIITDKKADLLET